jgi:hypothetical protein
MTENNSCTHSQQSAVSNSMALRCMCPCACCPPAGGSVEGPSHRLPAGYQGGWVGGWMSAEGGHLSACTSTSCISGTSPQRL